MSKTPKWPSLYETIDEQMVRVGSGTILMKDERSKRAWHVSLSPYLISKFAFTQDLYHSINPDSSLAARGIQSPMVDLSWIDVVRFCNQLSRDAGLNECYSLHEDSEKTVCNWEANGYRLPTEAEWEYACRGGSSEARYGELDDIAWYSENSGDHIHDVGQKQANAFGLFDTIGNTWEWCWDIYDAEVYGAYRVFRGGGWSDKHRGCRASCRRRSHPTFHIDDIGFRLARSIAKPTIP